MKIFEDLSVRGESTKNYKAIFISLIIFVISLPFTGIEWNLFHISRFELKITMISFPLLFIAWLWNSFKFPRKRDRSEKLFYTFVFLYGASQFTSLVNSPMPVETIKQCIIVGSLLIMMVVISETILDKRMAAFVLTTMGTLSLVVGIIATGNYYLFADWQARLGQKNALGIIDLGGDAIYFGDILLYSIGAVFFVILNLSKKKYWIWARWLLLFLWFSAIVLTFTKGVLLSVFCFFVCLFLVWKKKRCFIVINASIFVAAIILNLITVNGMDHKAMSKTDSVKLKYETDRIGNKTASKLDSHKLEHKTEKVNLLLVRLNMWSGLGRESLSIRQKAIIVSVKNSMERFWFGHGAGLSQTLLPNMANDYDKTVDVKTKELLMRRSVYGEMINLHIIDSHFLFITEFFNVGIVGVIFLICLVGFVVTKQVRILKTSCSKSDDMNKLLFATLIAMLVSRMTFSLIVVPFLWFILGLSFGISKLCKISRESR